MEDFRPRLISEELQDVGRRNAQRIAEMTRDARSATAEQLESSARTATATEALARDAADAKRDSHKAVVWARIGAAIGFGSLALAALEHFVGR